MIDSRVGQRVGIFDFFFFWFSFFSFLLSRDSKMVVHENGGGVIFMIHNSLLVCFLLVRKQHVNPDSDHDHAHAHAHDDTHHDHQTADKPTKKSISAYATSP